MNKNKEESTNYIYSFKSEYATENGNVLKNNADEIEISNNTGVINKYKDNKKVSSKKITKKELEKYKQTQIINLNDIVPVITQMTPFISLGKIPSPTKKQESPTPTPTVNRLTPTKITQSKIKNAQPIIPKIVNDNENIKQIKKKSPKKTK